MDIDSPNQSDGGMGGLGGNGFHLYPVSVNDSGEGLPYAPVDWPKPGDRWGWKVGKRITISGYFVDRYLYLPSRLQTSIHKRRRFASKLSAKEFIRTTFPDADVDAFFASFSWKIPSNKQSVIKGSEEEVSVVSVSSDEMPEHSDPDSQSEAARCKAGNKMCSSLVETRTPPSEAMVCYICCSEPGFCRDCCCILCSKTINSAHGGCSYIRCEAAAGDRFTCGHIAHMDCAFRSYMAGTVGGSIGLDAEYYCRRCDTRTDLIPFVTKLLQACECISSGDDVERFLKIGTSILRGSKKMRAKKLLHHVELAMGKLKNGMCLEEIWKMEDISAVASGKMSNHGLDALDMTNFQEPLDIRMDVPEFLSGNFDHRIESLKLEEEISQVLQELKKSQEHEFKIAEERLSAQKSYLVNLYQLLHDERSKLSTHTSSADPGALLDSVAKRVDQIKWESTKLKEMEGVAKGFGRISKDVLKEYFGLEMD